MIYSLQNQIRTLYKITLSKIQLYIIKIFTQKSIPCNSVWHNF